MIQDRKYLKSPLVMSMSVRVLIFPNVSNVETLFLQVTKSSRDPPGTFSITTALLQFTQTRQQTVVIFPKAPELCC